MRLRQHAPRYATKRAAAVVRARTPRRRHPRAKRSGGGMTRVFFIVVGTVVGLILAGGGAYALVRYLHHSPEYIVRQVEVEGASLLSPDEVAESAGLSPGKPILTYDIHGARRRLVSHPMVRDATIARRLPNTIVVQVVERAPIARVELNRTEFLVDRDGLLLTQAGPQENLPLIEGVYVHVKDPACGMRIGDTKLDVGLRVVRLCAQSPVLAEIGIASVNVRSLGNVRLYLKPGPRVVGGRPIELGEDGKDDFGQELARLARGLEQSPGRRLVSCDLTSGALPSFVFE